MYVYTYTIELNNERKFLYGSSVFDFMETNNASNIIEES